MRSRVLAGLAAVAMVGMGPAAALAQRGSEAPPRTADGWSLVVPEEDTSLGRVFHALPGHPTKVEAVSDAPLEAFTVTTREPAGYVCATEAGESLTLATGWMRVAVESLTTGNAARDAHFRSARWLDAEAHPDIIFRLTGFEQTEGPGADGDASRRTYRGTIRGEMRIAGSTQLIEIKDAEVTIVRESDQSRRIAPGDLMRIRCSYVIEPRAYGISNSLVGRTVAKKLKVSQDLYLSTERPVGPPVENPDDFAPPEQQPVGPPVEDDFVPAEQPDDEELQPLEPGDIVPSPNQPDDAR